ncbi:hypothetical protein Emag_003477 [Eimeria magna]
MVATRRTVRASTRAQRPRRIVARATPPRPKRSRSASTASATRDAAGLPPRTRARRALLTTAAEPATLRRSSSPARSSPDRAVSIDTPLASRQLSPLRRVALDPSPVPADLTQWGRGIFDRLPRLDTVPRNYADLRASLQAVELAVQALDRPADAFHITMQQLHPRLQAHIRTCMTAQPDPSHRLNDLQYVARLAINFDTLARTYPGRGEHRPQDANTLTLNDDFYAPPASDDPPAAKPPAASRAPATPPARRHQRTAPTPSGLLQEPPPASWAAAIHHLNQQAPRAPPQPGALSSPVAMIRPPAPSLGPCFFCNAPDHGHRVCPSYLRACQHDPTLASKCPACRAPGFCPASCPRRQYFIRSTRFPYLEADRFGHSCYIRADLPSPAWFHPGPLRAALAHERPTPQAQQQPSVAFVQLHPGAADAAPPSPANTDPRPTTPPPADPPAAQRADFCAAPPAPSALSAPPAICNHTRHGSPPRAPKSPTHMRAWATIDGVRCEVIIVTGADLSLISADVLRRHRSYQPWAPAHGSVTGVNNHTLQVLGRVALAVRLGPLKITAPFVVPGVAFAALLGVDFLYEHEIAVSVARHALIFEGHGGQIFLLLGHHPRLAPLCALAQGVALNPGSTAWVRATLPSPATAPASPLAHLVAPHSPAVRLAPAAMDNVRLVATDSALSPTDGTADTPSYEKLPGGFIPTLPSPNSCEFRDRFNDGSEPLSATSLLKARLDTGDAQRISTAPGRLAPATRQALREAVAELDAQGITEPSTGCWSTRIVMVRKASGAWRLCCDYRAINKHVRIPQQPLPRTDDILASFNGKKYFSALDMCKGFYQIEIAEEDRPKSSFVTPDCQRQYRRLPFGFASSPAIFQRMVDLLLSGMKWVSAVGYIDDIIVYSDTWDAHRAHLRQLFWALRDANLQLHPGKCSFGAAAVRHLGHIVSRDGIKPRPYKVQAILEMPVPKTAKAVQALPRKCQHYRKFIPNFSITAEPLFQAATRQKDFTWTPAADTAWRAPCKALTSEPVLAHPDYKRPFYLDCGGSGDGLGAVLLQPYDEGERVVAYASRSLLDHERKWTATELEAAALWVLETFRHYIDTHRSLHPCGPRPSRIHPPQKLPVQAPRALGSAPARIQV